MDRGIVGAKTFKMNFTGVLAGTGLIWPLGEIKK